MAAGVRGGRSRIPGPDDTTMRWLQTEPLLKGVYLGLVLYAALQVAVPNAPDPWQTLLHFNLVTLAGLVLALGVAAVLKVRAGYRLRGQPLSFLLLLLLESPQAIYAGILGGTVVATWLTYDESKQQLLLTLLGVAALAGLGMNQLRLIRHRLVRLGLVLLVAGGAVYGAIEWFDVQRAEAGRTVDEPLLFALQLLIGLPFFYLLVFAGQEEETESDIGVLCALLGVGLGLLIEHWPEFRLQLRSVLFLGPALIYLWYVFRVLPRLRVLKYAFRGVSHLQARRHRPALLAFRRALAHDPGNQIARKGYWEVHTRLDLDRLPTDHALLALVDFDLCLERAGGLLVQGRPSAEQLAEARRLLQLVLTRDAAARPAIDYWEAVAQTHEGRLEDAAATLGRLLDPGIYGQGNVQRRAVLLPAWNLALRLHPGLAERIGRPQLALPGRRLEAIAAVERHLADQSRDTDVLEFKRQLYADLTEAEYRAGPPADPQRPRADFDYAFVQQLGLELVVDPERWPRGVEFLHIAAHGLPALGPSLFVQIAKTHQRAGDEAAALQNFELARQAGRDIGPANLADREARAYFGTVKYLGDLALHRGDLTAALENYRLAAASPVADGESYRSLAEVYERQGEVMTALRANETALLYLPRDKDLLERKQRYYFSLPPQELRDKLAQVRAGFDFDYCLTRAKTLLDGAQYSDLEWLEVAEHLVELALVGDASGFRVRLLQARVLLRRGEREKAVTHLEQLRAQKPASFASGDEENAWFLAQQVLGDLYLEGGHPEQAIPCYLDFRKNHQSGARTVFKLGQAYEQLGDTAKAVKCYKLVTGYDGNPLVYEARAALSRMQTPSSSAGSGGV